MNGTRHNRALHCAGFTIVETVLALSILAMVLTITTGLFVYVVKQTRAGTSQGDFIQMGRIAQQKIVDHVQRGKAVGIGENCINIMTTNYSGMYRIVFVDEDSNLATVEDNYIKYDPDVYDVGDEVPICNYVHPLGDKPMFSIYSSARGVPDAIVVAFHLGDGPGEEYTGEGGTGKGYQGLEVRFSASPRNLQLWHDQ